MAKQSKNNTNLILGICAAVAVVVVVVVLAVVLINKGNSINDDYFKSDDTKYVLTMETGETSSEEDPQPVKAHEVYTYEGDKITGLKTYYEYTDADAAKTAYDKVGDEFDKESYESIELNGKYIVLTAKADQYENLKADDIKANIELMEQLKNLGDGTDENVEVEEDEVVTEDEGEEEEEE